MSLINIHLKNNITNNNNINIKSEFENEINNDRLFKLTTSDKNYKHKHLENLIRKKIYKIKYFSLPNTKRKKGSSKILVDIN